MLPAEITLSSSGPPSRTMAGLVDDVVQSFKASEDAHNTPAARRTFSAAVSALADVAVDREADSAWPRDEIDYRAIATEATAALDMLLRMLRADLSILKGASKELVPAAAVEAHVRTLRGLVEDARKQFKWGGDLAFPSIRIGSMDLSSGQRSQAHSEMSSPPGKRGPSARNDATASATGDIVVVANAGETYDVRMFDPVIRWRDTEADDQNTHLRGKIQKLAREKGELQAELAAAERRIDELITRFTKESDRALRAQQQMELDLKLLTQALSGEELPADGPEVAPIGRGAKLPKAVIPAAQPVATPSLATAPRPDTAPAGPAAAPGLPSRPPAGPNAAMLSRRALDESASTASTGCVSNRYQKFEAMYFATYEGRGLEMIWNCIDTVFRCEYEAPPPLSPSRAPSPTLAGSAAAATGSASNPYQSFFDAFSRHIVAPLSTEESFNSAVRNITPLRSDYIASCLQARVKANSGVVRLLSHIVADGSVDMLDLDGNYVGDAGLPPLLPILARLHNLRTLRLSNNGLRNDGAAALCKAAASHPSLAVIDLSQNAISRSGGKQLLALVSTSPRIVSITLDGTAMDGALRERICAVAAENAARQQGAATL